MMKMLPLVVDFNHIAESIQRLNVRASSNDEYKGDEFSLTYLTIDPGAIMLSDILHPLNR